MMNEIDRTTPSVPRTLVVAALSLTLPLVVQ